MKPYELIQSLYIIIFGLLLGRNGFRWNWFLPLAGGFLLMTLLTVPEIGRFLIPGAIVAEPGDRLNLMAAPMMLIFYPLHAFVTVAAAKRLPTNLTGVESKVVKAAVYIGTAMFAGFLWTVLMGIIFLIFIPFR